MISTMRSKARPGHAPALFSSQETQWSLRIGTDSRPCGKEPPACRYMRGLNSRTPQSVAYGPDRADLFRRAAIFVDKILKEAFDSASIHWVRFSHKMKSLRQRLLEAGWLSGKQITAKLGIKCGTLGRWRQTGRIKSAHLQRPRRVLYWLPDELALVDANIAHSGTDKPTARGAV